MDENQVFLRLKNADKFPPINDSIKDLINYTFAGNRDRILNKPTYETLQKEYDRLANIFQSEPFHKKKEFSSLDDLMNTVGSKWLANLLFIIYSSDLRQVGVEDIINFQNWRRENFIAGFCAFQLCQEYGISQPEDLFLYSYFSEISLLLISGSQPDAFSKIYKKYESALIERFESPDDLLDLVNEYNLWFLNNWGIPEKSLAILQTEKSRSGSKNISLNINQKIILFSRITAKYMLRQEKFIKYHQFESLYKSTFGKKSKDFQILLVELIRVINKQAVFFDYKEVAELRIFGVLKEHIDILNKDLFKYEDLVNEVIKANKFISKQKKEIRLLRDRIENSQVRDAITGLFNHTYLQEFLQQKIREAVRYEYPLTLILFDVDDFQNFNKSQGYAAGNEVLRQLAALIRGNLRQSDVLARYGNDEFAVVLPYTGLPHSQTVAEKITGLIKSNKFEDRINEKLHKITISLGYTSVVPDKTFVEKDRLLRLALMALDKAKNNGGNHINLAQI